MRCAATEIGQTKWPSQAAWRAVFGATRCTNSPGTRDRRPGHAGGCCRSEEGRRGGKGGLAAGTRPGQVGESASPADAPGRPASPVTIAPQGPRSPFGSSREQPPWRVIPPAFDQAERGKDHHRPTLLMSVQRCHYRGHSGRGDARPGVFAPRQPTCSSSRPTSPEAHSTTVGVIGVVAQHRRAAISAKPGRPW